MSIGILPTHSPIPTAPVDVVGDDELYEVIDGQRVRTPPMATISVWTASRIARLLGNIADDKLGRVIVEALFRLPAPINRDRRPDVAFVSYSRWARTRQVPLTDPWDVVPNLATEVVSPNDNAGELETKIAEYFHAGVELVWVVHPTMRKIHVYSSPTQPISVLNPGDVLDGGTVVPGFSLPLAALFGEATETGHANGVR